MNYNPYENLPKVPSFEVISDDVRDGEKMPLPHVSGIFGAGGEDISPHLSWRGFPGGTEFGTRQATWPVTYSHWGHPVASEEAGLWLCSGRLTRHWQPSHSSISGC